MFCLVGFFFFFFFLNSGVINSTINAVFHNLLSLFCLYIDQGSVYNTYLVLTTISANHPLCRFQVSQLLVLVYLNAIINNHFWIQTQQLLVYWKKGRLIVMRLIPPMLPMQIKYTKYNPSQPAQPALIKNKQADRQIDIPKTHARTEGKGMGRYSSHPE